MPTYSAKGLETRPQKAKREAAEQAERERIAEIARLKAIEDARLAEIARLKAVQAAKRAAIKPSRLAKIAGLTGIQEKVMGLRSSYARARSGTYSTHGGGRGYGRFKTPAMRKRDSAAFSAQLFKYGLTVADFSAPRAAGEGRLAAANRYLSKNPTTYTSGRGAVRITRTYKNKGFTLAMAATIAAGESTQAFSRLYQQQTKALGRAKGAAKGASIKAGLTSEAIAEGLKGKTFKVSLQDGVGISDSVKGIVKPQTPEEKAKAKKEERAALGQQRVAAQIGASYSGTDIYSQAASLESYTEGQPTGNTLLQGQRARQIAIDYRQYGRDGYSQERMPAINYLQAKREGAKYEGEKVTLYDREGRQIGSTIKQLGSSAITFGGTPFLSSMGTQYGIKLFEGGLIGGKSSFKINTMQYLLQQKQQEKASEDHWLVQAQKYKKEELLAINKAPYLYLPLQASRTAADLTVISLGVGIVNLEKQAREFFQKQVGSGASVSDPSGYLEEEKEPTGEFIQGLISGTWESGGDIRAGISKGAELATPAVLEYGALGTIGNIGAYFAGGSQLRTPNLLKPFSVVTKEGAVLVSKNIAIEIPRTTKSFVLGGKYQGEFAKQGKYFLGKPKYERVLYESTYGIPAKSRGFEQAGVTPTQISIQRGHLADLEKTGFVKKGTVSFEKSAEKQMKRELKEKLKMEKTMPKRSLDDITQMEETSILKAGSTQQFLKAPTIEAGKGSVLTNLIKSGEMKPQGFEAAVKAFKTSPEVERDIMRVVGEKNVKRKIHDFDFDETVGAVYDKTGKNILKEGSGVTAAKAMVTEAKAGAGREWIAKGGNISIQNMITKKTSPIINIPKMRDVDTALEAGSIGASKISTGKVYNLKYPTATQNILIYKGSGKKLKMFDVKFQSPAKTVSMTALQTKESLLAAGAKPELVKEILSGAKTAMSPFAPRAMKDVVDPYVRGLKSIKFSLSKGDYRSAKETSLHLKKMREYYSYVKWDKELANWKPTLEFSAPSPLTKGRGALESIALGEISSARGLPLDVGLKGTSMYGSPSASISLTPEAAQLQPLGKHEFYHVGDISGKIDAGEIGSIRDAGFFTTKSVGTALGTVGGGSAATLYKITVKDNAKILRIETEMDQDLLGRTGVAYAKEKGYQAVDRPISTLAGGSGDREFVILDSKIITSVRQIRKPPKSIPKSSPFRSLSSKSAYTGSILHYSQSLPKASASLLYSGASPSSRPSPYSPSSPYTPSPTITPSPYTPPSPPTSPPIESPPSYPSPKSTLTPSGSQIGLPTLPPSIPILTESKLPKGLIVAITGSTSKPKRRPSKPRADFLGSTRVAEITGFRTKKSDIIYGRERTFRLTQKDIKKSAKGKFGKKGTRKTQVRKSLNLFSISRLTKAQVSKQKVSIKL